MESPSESKQAHLFPLDEDVDLHTHSVNHEQRICRYKTVF